MTITTAPRKLGLASDSQLGGRPPRFEGAMKTRGAVPFAYDQPVAGLAHGVLVGATVAAGRVAAIDTAAAEAAPGVIAVHTRAGLPALKGAHDFLGNPPADPVFHALSDDITFFGQPIGLVVAETFEQATEAARLVRVTYEAGDLRPEMALAPPEARLPLAAMDRAVGEAEAVLADCEVQLDLEYRLPREYQMPIELNGLTAAWDGDRLTLWEPNQWLDGAARSYSEWFGIPFENVRVISPYIGGGFGSKGFAQGFGALVAQSARILGRPVRMVLTRAQIFQLIGGRTATWQRLQIGADRSGLLRAIVQDAESEAPMVGMWAEGTSGVTQIMYRYDAYAARQRAVRVNATCPGAKRAPGANPSAYGIECAIDELAHEIGMDPLQIRLLNYAERDPFSGNAWSTRELRAAFEQGAERFGWSGRSLAPRSMRDGRELIGWGVAAGAFPVLRAAGEARVELHADGTVAVSSSSTDMGQGAYTVVAQTAAELFGVGIDRVRVGLGDSVLPRAGVTGGSRMAMTMTGATWKAGQALIDELKSLAMTDPASPFAGRSNAVEVAEGRISLPGGEAAMEIGAFLTAIGRESLGVTRDTLAEAKQRPEDAWANWTTASRALPPAEGDFARYSWCAHFVEVRVDEDFGTVRVSRVVSAFDCGRLFSPLMAESQFKGGVIMGIGQALLEEGIVDPRIGRVMNDNLGDYLLPVNADIPEIEVISVGRPDYEASVLGGKGVGEVGIVGVAPAIANAVFHATGKRVRTLPITMDRLL
ncbi:xanthine dehydrogenase family protein molybdopterin-binding subunit [Frigidibacter sp. MR17.24]|uniref:xanthine dehydrogenase family protein molybdopterin-binding subunit n=1 Tax=Frigidibacter sp. MR17.24 TaxID=3127345 RepID=UPI003012E692